MLSNSSFTYVELRWVNLLYYAQVDGQSSQSSPTFYTPAYYPLSLPHPALPLFTHSQESKPLFHILKMLSKSNTETY